MWGVFVPLKMFVVNFWTLFWLQDFPSQNLHGISIHVVENTEIQPLTRQVTISQPTGNVPRSYALKHDLVFFSIGTGPTLSFFWLFSRERRKKGRMSQRHPRTRNGSFSLKMAIFCEISLGEESGGYFFSRLCFFPQIGASRSSSVLLGSPRFSSVLLGPPRFSSVLLGVLIIALLGSPRFSSVLLGPPRCSHHCSPRFSSVLLGSPRFCSVLLGAPRCSAVLLGVLLGVLGAKFAKKNRLRFLSELLQESRVWCFFCKFGVVPQDFDHILKHSQNFTSCYWVMVFWMKMHFYININSCINSGVWREMCLHM